MMARTSRSTSSARDPTLSKPVAASIEVGVTAAIVQPSPSPKTEILQGRTVNTFVSVSIALDAARHSGGHFSAAHLKLNVRTGSQTGS